MMARHLTSLPHRRRDVRRVLPPALLVLLLVQTLFAPPLTHAQVGSASPGKLAAPHARLEGACDACHVPFGGVPAKNCLRCHTAIADRVSAGLGYHADVKAQPCTDCHKEHRGRKAALAPEPPAAFRHSTTAFPLEGDHAQLACDRCHGEAGARRWIGLSTSCRSCHADRQHRGALGSECQKCHRARGFLPTKVSLADHQTPMTGGHATVPCVGCHKGGARLTETPQPCALCHQRPHGGTKAACETCHQVAAWNQVTFTHAFAPDRLPGKHQTAKCLRCHPAFGFRRTSFECAACHQQASPHEPMGGCANCHSATSWKTMTFDHDQPSIGFALTGGHRTAPCSGCHPQRGSFRGAARRCAQCHADPHRGQFSGAPAVASAPPSPPSLPLLPSLPSPAALPTAPPAAPPSPPLLPSLPSPAAAPAAATTASADCARCHTTEAWRPSRITAANHQTFALRGAHAAAACASCHAGGTFVGAPRACDACHQDSRHRGRLGTSCASCHSEQTWTEVARFDHGRTGFALEHQHARTGCKACHGKDGRRLATVDRPTACQTCHRPARHGLQFGARCAQCHRPTTFRDVPSFDHAARTDFPLELRHSTLPCLTCHDARQRPAVNPACRTCHGDPHRASNSFDCLDCHRSDRWRIIRFDHDLTSYPLVGGHRVASCGGCHSNPNWTGVRTDCVACHAFDRPQTSDHPMEITCDDCHTATRWRAILR